MGLPFSPGACASKSAVGKYALWVDSSTQIVLAPFLVTTLSITLKLSAVLSLMIVAVPVPFEVKIKFVFESKPTPSQPSPIGSVVTTFPFVASTTINCFSQPANNDLKLLQL